MPCPRDDAIRLRSGDELGHISASVSGIGLAPQARARRYH